MSKEHTKTEETASLLAELEYGVVDCALLSGYRLVSEATAASEAISASATAKTMLGIATKMAKGGGGES